MFYRGGNKPTIMELNSRLQPKDSPIDKHTGAGNSLAFDAQYERGIVSNTKMGVFTADKIVAGTINASVVSVINLDAGNITTGSIDAGSIDVYNLNANNITTGTLSADYVRGGTLEMGGSGNGDGVIRVNNTGGSQAVLLNNEGVRVDGGSIAVYNDSGDLTFDSSGLVSGANFASLEETNSVDGSVTSTSGKDITNRGTISISRNNTKVMFLYSGDFFLVESGTTSCQGRADLYVSGNYQNTIFLHSGNNHLLTLSNFDVKDLNSGNHSFYLKGRLQNLSGTARMEYRNLKVTAIQFGT